MSGLHPLRVSRVGRIADVHPATWASLERGRNLYQSHPWLQWAEQSCGVPARYVLVHATSGALVAAMPCYLLTRAQTSWNSWYDPLHVLTGEVADQAAPNWYPVLLLGSVSGYRTDLLIHPALAPHDRESVLQALLQGCASLGADLGASARAFMYAPPDTARTTASLSRGEGAMAPLLTSAASRIVPTGRTLDEWLATFGQKRRCALRRELTMFRDGPAVVQRCRLSACLEAVGPLLGNLHRRHGAQDSDEETGRYLASQAEHLDDVSDVFLEMVDGRPAGFSLCYQWGPRSLRARGRLRL